MEKEKINIDSWYTPKELRAIEYDGRACTSNCRREGCPHEEIHAEYLKEIFDKVPFETRVRIIKWLSDEDFEDTVRELYDTHCSDCWGTGEAGENEDGDEMKCLCVHEAEKAMEADAQWASREI